MTRYAHCINGHRWTEANTRHYGPGKRYRACRTCASTRERLRYRNKKLQPAGKENPSAEIEDRVHHLFSWMAAVGDRPRCDGPVRWLTQQGSIP